MNVSHSLPAKLVLPERAKLYAAAFLFLSLICWRVSIRRQRRSQLFILDSVVSVTIFVVWLMAPAAIPKKYGEAVRVSLIWTFRLVPELLLTLYAHVWRNALLGRPAQARSFQQSSTAVVFWVPTPMNLNGCLSETLATISLHLLLLRSRWSTSTAVHLLGKLFIRGVIETLTGIWGGTRTFGTDLTLTSGDMEPNISHQGKADTKHMHPEVAASFLPKAVGTNTPSCQGHANSQPIPEPSSTWRTPTLGNEISIQQQHGHLQDALIGSLRDLLESAPQENAVNSLYEAFRAQSTKHSHQQQGMIQSRNGIYRPYSQGSTAAIKVYCGKEVHMQVRQAMLGSTAAAVAMQLQRDSSAVWHSQRAACVDGCVHLIVWVRHILAAHADRSAAGSSLLLNLGMGTAASQAIDGPDAAALGALAVASLRDAGLDLSTLSMHVTRGASAWCTDHPEGHTLQQECRQDPPRCAMLLPLSLLAGQRQEAVLVLEGAPADLRSVRVLLLDSNCQALAEEPAAGVEESNIDGCRRHVVRFEMPGMVEGLVYVLLLSPEHHAMHVLVPMLALPAAAAAEVQRLFSSVLLPYHTRQLQLAESSSMPSTPVVGASGEDRAGAGDAWQSMLLQREQLAAATLAWQSLQALMTDMAFLLENGNVVATATMELLAAGGGKGLNGGAAGMLGMLRHGSPAFPEPLRAVLLSVLDFLASNSMPELFHTLWRQLFLSAAPLPKAPQEEQRQHASAVASQATGAGSSRDSQTPPPSGPPTPPPQPSHPSHPRTSLVSHAWSWLQWILSAAARCAFMQRSSSVAPAAVVERPIWQVVLFGFPDRSMEEQYEARMWHATAGVDRVWSATYLASSLTQVVQAYIEGWHHSGANLAHHAILSLGALSMLALRYGCGSHQDARRSRLLYWLRLSLLVATDAGVTLLAMTILCLRLPLAGGLSVMLLEVPRLYDGCVVLLRPFFLQMKVGQYAVSAAVYQAAIAGARLQLLPGRSLLRCVLQDFFAVWASTTMVAYVLDHTTRQAQQQGRGRQARSKLE